MTSDKPVPQPTPEDLKANQPPRPFESEKSAPIEESKPVPPKFNFKIVKADPKNSFDFEDVADK